MFRTGFPHFKQMDSNDCGPTCLRIISKHYGKETPIDVLRENSYITNFGVSFKGVSEAADILGFDTKSVLLSLDELVEKAPLPCIVHWESKHFVVVYRITKKTILVSDPNIGLMKYTTKEFKEGWIPKNTEEGAVLLLQPTESFYNSKETTTKPNTHLGGLLKYFLEYKKQLRQVLLGFFIGTIIQLSLPFLTQSIVDYGIETDNYSFITIVLLAQLFLTISLIVVNVIRDWILLHISTRIGIRMVSDHLTKLLKLPISYFEKKSKGDILQRVFDNSRIEQFITGGSLSLFFDLMNIVVFSVVLIYYSLPIFSIFLIGTVIYMAWGLFFLRRKATIDHKMFNKTSEVNNKLLEIVTGLKDIKLNQSEKRRKDSWFASNIKLFQTKIDYLKVNHLQLRGGQVINALKNILIIYFAAKFVIQGSISLGAMLAIQFIIGSLNVPISKLLLFFVDFQKASLSQERLSEIDQVIPEKVSDKSIVSGGNIILKDVSLQYGEPSSRFALNKVSLTIPENKVTAIVGPSGSGKSSLLKLLVKFYEPTTGSIRINNLNLSDLDTAAWRSLCGVVIQGGVLFDDSLERNITESLSTEKVNSENLNKALESARLTNLVEQLPHGLQTNIGINESVLSGGEKQRILLARIIYKNPRFVFLDEATSSLDSLNEHFINDNLSAFYKNKTVVVIAHRLSTIKNADNIIVLDKGEIIEEGNHEFLLRKKAFYYQLVNHQIDF